MLEPHIRLTAVGHAFTGGSLLFTNLTRDFKPGTLCALTGPSGSGKSTLLSLIAGFETPSEGHITVSSSTTPLWVFQNPYGLPRRSALDHVAYPLLAQGFSRADAERQAQKILGDFNLERVETSPYSALSGGEAARLMLARAVAAQPPILLVDEPTAQLDTRASATVNGVLTSLADEGRIVLIATHDPDTVAACHTQLDLRDYAQENAL